jgi:hypothetical protein
LVNLHGGWFRVLIAEAPAGGKAEMSANVRVAMKMKEIATIARQVPHS